VSGTRGRAAKTRACIGASERELERWIRRPGLRQRPGALLGLGFVLGLALGLAPGPSSAQPVPRGPAAARGTGADSGNHATLTPEGLVNLDFQDVELAVVIDTIAKLTNKNFIYDDRVRGRVTIVSPTAIPVDQAYKVFESVLQVKGFTTVEGPGGAIKVIPVRDAKESSLDTRTVGPHTPNTDAFMTRLIPLEYIDAGAISNTLKPLVSKDAALVSYAPTNTLILTDSASNIRRILAILNAIDIETYKEELAVIRVQYADATALAQQLSDVFGGEVSSAGGATTPAARIAARFRPQPATAAAQGGGEAGRNQVRIITDDRTNALIILAARATLDDMRALIRKLDVPVEGGGRIQVYYLKHADAEDLADTLNSLLGGETGGGGPGGPAAALQPQALRAVSELSGSVTSVTADVGTNSLVIQASPEGYAALVRVIEKLDIERPQVLVEALIMEVTVSDSRQLGLNWLLQFTGANAGGTLQGVTDSTTSGALTGATQDSSGNVIPPAIIAASTGNVLPLIANLAFKHNGNVIQTIIRAAASDANANIISAPHILTSDNEEAEILVGDNIPIITNRVQSAAGISTTSTNPDTTNQLATSVNVERQDIGVTLRVTPQITEGDSLRLQIFQEITRINSALQTSVGDVNAVGPALSNRRVENTVVAQDGATIVIGGLISDDYENNATKVPWLADIPFLGWLFKTTQKNLVKNNLLVFLTPHIIRSPADLEKASIGKREEFRRRSEEALGKTVEEPAQPPLERPIGLLANAGGKDQSPAGSALAAIAKLDPLERMREIEREQAQARAKEKQAERQAGPAPRYVLLAATYSDSSVASATLTTLVDAGYDGRLVSSGSAGHVRYELRIGPYKDLQDAERTAETLRHSYDLSPKVLVQTPEAHP
jgi:general secretion pathway protein D